VAAVKAGAGNNVHAARAGQAGKHATITSRATGLAIDDGAAPGAAIIAQLGGDCSFIYKLRRIGSRARYRPNPEVVVGIGYADSPSL
jgi:hypothetical protein